MNKQQRQDRVAISELRQIGKLVRLVSIRPRVYVGLLLVEDAKYYLIQLTTKDRRCGLIKSYDHIERPMEHIEKALTDGRTVEITLTEEDKA